MNQNSIKVLRKKFNVIYDKNLWKNKKKLEKIIKKNDIIIIRNKTQLNETLLKKTNNLKFVGRLGVGLDNINLKSVSYTHLRAHET